MDLRPLAQESEDELERALLASASADRLDEPRREAILRGLGVYPLVGGPFNQAENAPAEGSPATNDAAQGGTSGQGAPSASGTADGLSAIAPREGAWLAKLGSGKLGVLAVVAGVAGGAGWYALGGANDASLSAPAKLDGPSRAVPVAAALEAAEPGAATPAAGVSEGIAAPQPSGEPPSQAPSALPGVEPQEASRARVNVRSGAAPKRSHKEDTLAAELEQLEAARSALRAGRKERALAYLDEYQQTYPSGRLRTEVRVVRAEVLNQLGRRQEAVALARRLLDASPQGPYATRLQRIIDAP